MKNKDLKLRFYQEDVIQQVIKNNSSSLIQIPTGGGKTIIAKHLIEHFITENKRVLFIVPKIILMEQTIKVLSSLDPQLIHGNKAFDKTHQIFISTIQTISRRKEITFDVIFIDEIHYGFDGKMIDALIKQNPKARIIGLSATPYDKNGKLIHGFDFVINKYDMKYLINEGYLSPLISYELVKPNLSNVKITAGDYNLKELGAVVCNKYLITEVLYSTKELIEQSKKTIVFAVNIQHAKLLEIGYKELGFEAKSIHSLLGKNEINERLQWFEEESIKAKILLSVTMLTTGFDLPQTDCAVIARPTKSQNLYKQMVGRILRLADGKENATLLDCGNVIENLGMPLEPIKITNNKFRRSQMLCKDCNSNKFKLTKNDNLICWECKDCGSISEYINIHGFKCNKCFLIHNDKDRFFLKDKKLYLNCSCGFETLISVSKGEEKLNLIEDTSTYLLFEEAKEYVRNQGIRSARKWHFYKKNKPKFIPDSPNIIYKNKGWINWKDWLGIDSKYDQNYLSFEEAKNIVNTLNLTNEKDWSEFTKKDSTYKNQIPIFPNQYYKHKGWIDWNDWLGINKDDEKQSNQQNIIPFEEARNYAKSLKLTNELEWKNFYDKCFPFYKYPMEPKDLYSNDWINWKDWLGLE